jgi:hypothetical protein
MPAKPWQPVASKRRLLEDKANPLLVFEMVKLLRRCLDHGKGRMLPVTAKELYAAFAHAHRLIWLYPVLPNKAGIQKWTISHRNDLNFRLAQAGIDADSWSGEGELKLIDPDKLERAIDRQIDAAIEKQEREAKREWQKEQAKRRREYVQRKDGGLATVEEVAIPDPASIGQTMLRQHAARSGASRDAAIDHTPGIDDAGGLRFGSSSLGYHDYQRQYQESALRCSKNR